MNSKKSILILVTILVIGLLLASGSYALWSWTSNVNKNVVFNTSNHLKKYVVYDEGEASFVGDLSFDSAIHSTIAIYKTTNAADLVATIHMDINSIGDNMKTTSALKWKITQGDASSFDTEEIASGNFLNTDTGDMLTLVHNIDITTASTQYTIWVWIDGDDNSSSSLVGEFFDADIWTEINQLDGLEDVFEITKKESSFQNISATAIDNLFNITSYAITNSSSTPSSWTSITPVKVYNLSYNVSSTGTYYVWFKDENNRTRNATVTISAIDNSGPTCTFGSFDEDEISVAQTATITLSCTDSESGISNKSLEYNNFTSTMSNALEVIGITKERITNGYEYEITVKAKGTSSGNTGLVMSADTVKNKAMVGNSSSVSSADTIFIDNRIYIGNATVTFPQEEYEHTGNAITPLPTVQVEGRTLVKDTDYTIQYGNNINIGVATVTITGINNYKGTASATFNISYIATFYYNSNNTVGGTTISTSKVSCSTNNCTVSIPSPVRLSVGTYNNAYYGLNSSTGNMTQSIAQDVTTLTLSSSVTYYAIYSSEVTIYKPLDDTTCSTVSFYRNQWFTSTSAMSSTVLSMTRTGTTTNISDSLDGYDFSSMSASSGNESTQYTLEQATNSNITGFYMTIIDSITINFYYYNGTGQSHVTENSEKTLYCLNEHSVTFDTNELSIPTVVTSSHGPNNTEYLGLSTIPNGISTTTTINSSTTSYYAIYDAGLFTVTFATLDPYVIEYGSTQLSCNSTYVSNRTTYVPLPCRISLPTITTTTGRDPEGWYRTDDSFAGLPGAMAVISSNETLYAKSMPYLNAKRFSYDNTKSISVCNDVQCIIDYLNNHRGGVPGLNEDSSFTAEKFSYNNYRTSIACSDVQCMIDKLDGTSENNSAEELSFDNTKSGINCGNVQCMIDYLANNSS